MLVPEARRQLIGIVDRATSRLGVITELRQERESADAAELADRLSFDESNAGERLRRLQMYCGRSFLRMLDVLLKMRRPGESSPTPPARFHRAEPVYDPGPIEPACPALDDRKCRTQPPASHTTPGIATMQSIPPVAPFQSVSRNETPAPAAPVHPCTPPLDSLAAHDVMEQDRRTEVSTMAVEADEQNRWNEASFATAGLGERSPSNPASGFLGERDEGCEPQSAGRIGLPPLPPSGLPGVGSSLADLVGGRTAGPVAGNRKSRRSRRRRGLSTEVSLR